MLSGEGGTSSTGLTSAMGVEPHLGEIVSREGVRRTPQGPDTSSGDRRRRVNPRATAERNRQRDEGSPIRIGVTLAAVYHYFLGGEATIGEDTNRVDGIFALAEPLLDSRERMVRYEASGLNSCMHVGGSPTSWSKLRERRHTTLNGRIAFPSARQYNAERRSCARICGHLFV